MNNRFISLVLFVFFFISGCGTIAKLKSDEIDKRYYATGVCFQNVGKDSASRWVNYDNLWCYTPIILVDVPVSVAVDTLFYPIDALAYSSRKSDRIFWEDILKSNDSTREKTEYVDHFSTFTAKRIKEYINQDANGRSATDSKVLDMITDMALSNTDDINNQYLLSTIALHKNINKSTYLKIYELAKHQVPNYGLLTLLARNPATPTEYFDSYVIHKNYNVRISAALNPNLPQPLAAQLRNHANTTINTEMQKKNPSGWEINNNKDILKALDRGNKQSRQ